MEKHTKGPWKLIELDGITYINPDRGGDEYALIARITGPNLASSPHDANARLIAAAPELLEALLAIVKSRVCSDTPGVYLIPWDEIRIGLDAIRKATGE